MILKAWDNELGKIAVVDDEAYSLGKRVQPLMSSFCMALACCGCIKRRKPDHRHYEANARAFSGIAERLLHSYMLIPPVTFFVFNC